MLRIELNKKYAEGRLEYQKGRTSEKAIEILEILDGSIKMA